LRFCLRIKLPATKEKQMLGTFLASMALSGAEKMCGTPLPRHEIA
jgi:hypothetical protein